MDTTVSVGLQHASFKFTMCRSCHISYSQSAPLLLLELWFPGETTGFFLWKARLGISRFCEQKCDYVPPPLSTYLLLMITYLNQPITLIILKYSARQWCGYKQDHMTKQETGATSEKQGDSLWSLRTNYRTGGGVATNRVFHQAAEDV
jgi:hypothetical protein